SNRVCRQMIRKLKSLKQHSANYRSDRGTQMKSLKAILALSMFAVSSTAISAGFDNDPGKIIQENQRAMEAYAAELGKPAPKVETYRYGMELDVVKVISVTRKAKVCGVVP